MSLKQWSEDCRSKYLGLEKFFIPKSYPENILKEKNLVLGKKNRIQLNFATSQKLQKDHSRKNKYEGGHIFSNDKFWTFF